MKKKCLLIVVMVICVFCGACKSKQPIGQPAGNTENAEAKTAKENIIKALIDIQSATKIGVNNNRYGELLTNALSVYNFEKLKLKDEQNFIFYVDKIIHFHQVANDKWSGEEKIRNLSIGMIYLSRKELFTMQYELKQVGIDIDVSEEAKKEPAKMITDYALSLYWQITDKYLEKLKTELCSSQ